MRKQNKKEREKEREQGNEGMKKARKLEGKEVETENGVCV